jgi:choline dehydrogenase-like flavoprotein
VGDAALSIARSYDIVIIGSGAGGGTVAAELAPLVRDGRRVLVLEKGPRFADADFTGRELEMAEALYQDGGAFLTREGTLTLAFASAYGGSTVVYTGTSLTAPERVIRHWGVAGLDHADLVRRSAKYARQNNVHLLDAALLNDNNRLFVAGARAPRLEPLQPRLPQSGEAGNEPRTAAERRARGGRSRDPRGGAADCTRPHARGAGLRATARRQGHAGRVGTGRVPRAGGHRDLRRRRHR